MQPCWANGREAHGGNHYANAHTLDDARDYAYRMLTGTLGVAPCCPRPPASVSIDGCTWEFAGGWRRVSEPGVYHHYEVITREDVPADYVRPTL
jgi:hypothetical protein